MFKRFIISLLLSFLSLSSFSVLADSSLDKTEVEVIVLALNQTDIKASLVSTKAIQVNDISKNLNDQTSKTLILDSQQNNNEHTGWLLVLALIGFVMLSNRRGV